MHGELTDEQRTEMLRTLWRRELATIQDVLATPALEENRRRIASARAEELKGWLG